MSKSKANDLSALSTVLQKQVRKNLRLEFSNFFTTMTTQTEAGWPNISEQEMVEAIADALLDMGKKRKLGTAILQTLVHELQDRVNQSL